MKDDTQEAGKPRIFLLLSEALPFKNAAHFNIYLSDVCFPCFTAVKKHELKRL